MADDIVFIKKLDDVFIQLICEPSIRMELAYHFTFQVPGYAFMPAYKNKIWDGKIRLLNSMTGIIYYGLLNKIVSICSKLGYKITLDSNISLFNKEINETTIDKIYEYSKPKFEIRDFQRVAVTSCLKENRMLLLSPTASGKSFIMYMIAQYYLMMNKKVLIIVPLIGLVNQLSKNFKGYGEENIPDIHEISGGIDKNIDKDIVITTWQSITYQKKSWYEKFDVVICDEAHLFKAKSLVSIMEKCINIKYRFGFTGTLDDSQTNKLVLQGLFGRVVRVEETKALINKGTLANFKIKVISINHPKESLNGIKLKTYQEEIDWIVRNKNRNNFIKNLANGLSGNTLILFQYIEKHGDELVKIFANSNKKIHYIHGGIDSKDRIKIIEEVENSNNNIIIASLGTFSTGIDLVNLHNLIFGSPFKSKIRSLQSIGRVLRKGENKKSAVLYDIVDVITEENYAIKHFKERLSIYAKEGFDYKLYDVKLENINE